MNRTIAGIIAFAMLGALAPAPTLAGYYVETNSSTYGVSNVSSYATYTGLGYGNVNPPYATFYANPTYGTATGTTDTTGLVTSSFDKATIISPNSPGTGVASSSTDLSTATTHASGQSTNGGQAVSDAKLGDTIHFAVAGANASTVTTIGFQYVVHGIYLDFDPANADTELSAHLNIASASPNTQNLAFGANLDVQANSGNNGVPTVLTATAGFLFGGFGTAVITSQTPGDFVVSGTLFLPGAASSIFISDDLNAHQQSGAANLDYTSSFSFTSLPSNVSYTSDSGVFLAAAAVPEPGSLGLVLLGGGLTALAARQKRRGR